MNPATAVIEDRVAKLEEICKRMQEEAVNMRKDFEYKRWTDNLMHAKDREELDSISNRRNEFKILATGIEFDTTQPQGK